jgi:DNA-binding transcriptional MerR regulator
MSAATQLVELLELQGSTDLITKKELLDDVRSHRCRISERNLAYYTAQGLMASPIRLGQRNVVYPSIAAAQLVFVIRCRDAGLSIESIRELLPVWRYLQSGIRSGHIDLAEFEYIARSTINQTEANYAVPMAVSLVMSSICPDCLSKIEWTLKDGTGCTGEEAADLTLTFILAEMDDESQVGRRVAWTQLQLPGFDSPDDAGSTTVVLGIPIGVTLRCDLESPVADPKKPDSTTCPKEVSV